MVWMIFEEIQGIWKNLCALFGILNVGALWSLPYNPQNNAKIKILNIFAKNAYEHQTWY